MIDRRTFPVRSAPLPGLENTSVVATYRRGVWYVAIAARGSESVIHNISDEALASVSILRLPSLIPIERDEVLRQEHADNRI